CAVSVSGDYLVIGAYKTDVLPATATGAAYVYSRDYTQDFIYLRARITPLVV
ncbi:hypothetical protein T484DRAFT_1840223, partial [Baffinella frigidus]